MRIKLIAVALLMAVPACAQQPQPQQVEYNIKVTAQELDIIGRGLGSQPFNDVAPLIQKLRNQVVEQQQKSEPQKAVEPEKK